MNETNRTLSPEELAKLQKKFSEIKHSIKTRGFALSTASDGAAGLTKARAERPDFIILDLMLPKMPGLEVCKILKSDPATRHIPVLMLTARAEEIDRIVGLEFGADDYV